MSKQRCVEEYIPVDVEQIKTWFDYLNEPIPENVNDMVREIIDDIYDSKEDEYLLQHNNIALNIYGSRYNIL